MQNEFDSWNDLKKKIDAEIQQRRFPREGDVWLAVLGRNIGSEQNGSGEHFSRPVLILKKFTNTAFWALSLTSKQKPFDFYFNFDDPNGHQVAVILDQLKLISDKRLIRKLYSVSDTDFCEIKKILRRFLA